MHYTSQPKNAYVAFKLRRIHIKRALTRSLNSLPVCVTERLLQHAVWPIRSQTVLYLRAQQFWGGNSIAPTEAKCKPVRTRPAYSHISSRTCLYPYVAAASGIQRQGLHGAVYRCRNISTSVYFFSLIKFMLCTYTVILFSCSFFFFPSPFSPHHRPSRVSEVKSSVMARHQAGDVSSVLLCKRIQGTNVVVCSCSV